jgi:outer membrane PBP1 activator LpoA protein
MHGSISFVRVTRWVAALFCLALAYPASADDPAPEASTPHLALILPTDAPGSLAAAANAVRDGAMAAQEHEGDERTPQLRLYPTNDKDDSVVAAYEEAVKNGAIGVIGPLTRGAIAKLVASEKLDIPVLALNSLPDSKPVPNLYVLGLTIENDTRQVAHLMYDDGHRKPLIVETEGPLARRMRDAFLSEWKSLKGTQPELLTFGSQHDALTKLKEYAAQLKADCIFLAADSRKARVIRSVLGSDRPTYATSQVWTGGFGKVAGDNLELNGVKFVDMPWLLDPWSADVAAYTRSSHLLSSDLERLYALGVDSYRLSLLLAVSSPGAAIEMQGVTGTLRLSESRQFSRELMVGVVGDPPRTPQPVLPNIAIPTDSPDAATPNAPATNPATPTATPVAQTPAQ